jgi:Putative bacterial sensory transduction regulator
VKKIIQILLASVFLSAGAVQNVAAAETFSSMSAPKVERTVRGFREVSDFKEVSNNTYSFVIDGLKIVIFNKGETMQLYAGFRSSGTSLSTINEWNKEHRFTRAYLDSDNDPVLESDIDLTGGVTQENVDEFVRTFFASLVQYKKHIEG